MEALLKNQIADRRLIRAVERERAKLNTLPRVTEFYRYAVNQLIPHINNDYTVPPPPQYRRSRD